MLNEILQRLGLNDVPEESFEIVIVADDHDVLNDTKITSEKVNNKNLLAKLTEVSQ